MGAPGVEGRGDGSGFDGLGEGSSDEASGTENLAAVAETASEVSLGLATLRCSSEVAGVSGSPELPSAVQEPLPLAFNAAAEGCPADREGQLRARLVALEHVLEAVRALLEVGAVQEALNLVKCCPRQG